jgi:hypothetical protein
MRFWQGLTGWSSVVFQALYLDFDQAPSLCQQHCINGKDTPYEHYDHPQFIWDEL